VIFGNCAPTFWTIFPDSPYTRNTETRIRPSSNSYSGADPLVLVDTKFRRSSRHKQQMHHFSKHTNQLGKSSGFGGRSLVTKHGNCWPFLPHGL
jgi:hypothetical protein